MVKAGPLKLDATNQWEQVDGLVLLENTDVPPMEKESGDDFILSFMAKFARTGKRRR